MNAQILIKTANDWFEFSKRKTGQLDFVGKWEKNNLPNVEDYQQFISSTYFSPSWYVFIQTALNCNPTIYVSSDVDVSDKDIFDYLVHIGPLLAAVEAKDSLLAGELFMRRSEVFEKFAQLTQYIMEPLCVEILFSLSYGKMNNIDPDEISLIFESAKKKLEYDTSRESLDQAFMRYFKKNTVTVTLPLVGTNFYHWDDDIEPEALTKLTDNLDAKDLIGAAETIRRAKHGFYESLNVSVQAEPYNHVDKNSILVCIENVEAKLFGNPGLEKAGHIRALAAESIREAKTSKMSYTAKLASLSYREIVVQFTV